MERYKVTKNGYKFDKLFFWAILFIIFSVFLKVGFANNFDLHNKLYYECIGPTYCENPYREMECNREWIYGKDCFTECTEEWCNLDLLAPGVYGEPPPKYITSLPGIVVLLFVVALFLNHITHNKGKEFDLEIQITKKKVINLREAFKKWKFE